MNRRNFLRKTATVAIIAPIVAITTMPKETEYCVVERKGVVLDASYLYHMSVEDVLDIWRTTGSLPVHIPTAAYNFTAANFVIIEKPNPTPYTDMYYRGTYEECENWIKNNKSRKFDGISDFVTS